MPAVALETAVTYVAAAYVVFLTLIVVYVAVIGARAARLERELDRLGELIDQREESAGGER